MLKKIKMSQHLCSKLIHSVNCPFLVNDGSQGEKLNVAVSALFRTGTALLGKATTAPERHRENFSVCTRSLPIVSPYPL